MQRSMIGKCGIYCGACSFREQTNCPGCQEAAGDMFWGRCDIAICCGDNGLEHCGRCEKFPCSLLKDYAYDPEHGDGGERIENIKQWNDQGVDTWLLQRDEEN